MWRAAGAGDSAEEEREANMTRCDGCDELQARLEAAEKAINELQRRMENYSAFPGEDWIHISVPFHGRSIKAIEDGYLSFQATSKGAGSFISLGGPDGLATSQVATTREQDLSVYLPVRKGQIVPVKHILVNIKALTLFPSKGYTK